MDYILECAIVTQPFSLHFPPCANYAQDTHSAVGPCFVCDLLTLMSMNANIVGEAEIRSPRQLGTHHARLHWLARD